MLKSFVVILLISSSCFCYNINLPGNKTDNQIVILAESRLSGEESAPDFTLLTLDGEEISLSDFEGKIVLLDFWATWCPPCRKGVPDLVSIQNEYKNDVVVLGISFDQPSTQDDLLPFIEHYGINYHVLLGTLEVAMAYGNIQAIPTSFIIDREGKIINKHVGLVPKSVLVKEINTLLDN